MPTHEKFVIFDGIDGSGKTTLAEAFVQTLASRGKTIFHLAQTCKTSGEIPLPWPPSNEIIFSSEPTRAWIGAAIRNELIRNGTDYRGSDVAAAFALDRLILYTRFLIPMLERGAIVVQDRGVSSSIAYQPIMEKAVTLDELLAFPGNALALEHAPKHMVIARCSAKTAIARISARSDKKDDAIFEREDFLTRLAERYGSEWFKKLWEDRGTTVHYIDAEQSLEAVKAEAARLANEIFPNVIPSP